MTILDCFSSFISFKRGPCFKESLQATRFDDTILFIKFSYRILKWPKHSRTCQATQWTTPSTWKTPKSPPSWRRWRPSSAVWAVVLEAQVRASPAEWADSQAEWADSPAEWVDSRVLDPSVDRPSLALATTTIWTKRGVLSTVISICQEWQARIPSNQLSTITKKKTIEITFFFSKRFLSASSVRVFSYCPKF